MNFIKFVIAAQNLQIIKCFWLSSWVSISRVIALLPKAINCCPQQLQPIWKLASFNLKQSVFVCASQTSQSCSGALPQELGPWFCNQNLWLPSGTAFGREGQMSCRDSILDSNLNSARSTAWPASCIGYLLQNHKIKWEEFLFFSFLSVQVSKMSKLIEALSISNRWILIKSSWPLYWIFGSWAL